MLKKMFAILWLFAACAFALTIADVERSLKNSLFPSDSFEIRLSTTVESLAGTQTSDMYIVQKGPSKIYTELKSPMFSERSIVSGDRMKTTDLQSGKVKVIPYDGEALKSLGNLQVGLFAEDGWSTPKKLSDFEYVLAKGKKELYYNSQKKQIFKIVETLENGYSETLLEYDENSTMKKMVTMVKVNGVETKVTTLVQKTGTGADFPDRFFDF